MSDCDTVTAGGGGGACDEHAASASTATAARSAKLERFIAYPPLRPAAGPPVPGGAGGGTVPCVGLRRYATIGSVIVKVGVSPTPTWTEGMSVTLPTPMSFGNLLRSVRNFSSCAYVPASSMLIGTCVNDWFK